MPGHFFYAYLSPFILPIEACRTCVLFLLNGMEMSDNQGMKGVNTMDEMIQALYKIGMPADQIASIRDKFNGDLDGLTMYVLYCIAVFDDRHEYV